MIAEMTSGRVIVITLSFEADGRFRGLAHLRNRGENRVSVAGGFGAMHGPVRARSDGLATNSSSEIPGCEGVDSKMQSDGTLWQRVLGWPL